MFKDFISYFDIFFPFFVLYLIFLILAFIKNRKDICYVKDVIEVNQETQKQTVIFEKPRN